MLLFGVCFVLYFIKLSAGKGFLRNVLIFILLIILYSNISCNDISVTFTPISDLQ